MPTGTILPTRSRWRVPESLFNVSA